MKFLVLLLLSACVLPVGHLARTANPRQGVWVTETGHQVLWHVDQPEVVVRACFPGGPHGCVRWTPGETKMELWTIDSAEVAMHECAHALGFSKGMNLQQIQAETNGTHWQVVLPFFHGPAMEQPCGASIWSDGDRPGRLKTVEQYQHETRP